MKYFVALIFLTLPFLTFSQEKSEIKIKRSKLSEIKTLNEILIDLPSDARIISFELSSGNGSKSNTINGNGATMDDKKIKFLRM